MNIRISQTTAAAAAALTLLVSAPVFAQQTPGDDGTSANGPITIIKNAVAETTPIASQSTAGKSNTCGGSATTTSPASCIPAGTR